MSNQSLNGFRVHNEISDATPRIKGKQHEYQATSNPPVDADGAMQIHLDLDGLVQLFARLRRVPGGGFESKEIDRFVSILSGMAIDTEKNVELHGAWNNEPVVLRLSVVMSDVDVTEIEASGNSALLHKIGEVANELAAETEKHLLDRLLVNAGPLLDPKEREAREGIKKQAARTAAQPVLDELAEVGYPVTWITNLSQYGTYEKAIPVLLEWLQKSENFDVRAAIAAALNVAWLPKSAARLIVPQFLEEKEDNRLKFSLGGCLGYLASPAITDSLIGIVLDKRHGNSRTMIVNRLGKIKDEKTADALLSLLKDNDLPGQAIVALAELKEKRAAPFIEPFLRHPQPWIRREASKALKRMGIAVPASPVR
jgi:hypothetical protein